MDDAQFQLEGVGRRDEETEMERIGHWIDGAQRPVPAESQVRDVYNPSTGRVIRHVQLGTASDAHDAISAAARAFAEWRATPLSARVDILFRFRQLLVDQREDLATLISEEQGKTLSDARGEVSRGIEVVEFACGLPHLLKGEYTEHASRGIDVHSVRQPLGISLIVSPFNFPAMVPMWFFPIAIATGNSVVLKPSERAPSASNWLAHLWQLSGLPNGVFNVLHGDQEIVKLALADDRVASVSFVGSTPVARTIYEQAAAHGKRVQALGGAKNHMLVCDDADLDVAADGAVSAAFGASGQRCMAISVVVAVSAIADELVRRIAERSHDLQVGGDPSTRDIGPVISSDHRERVVSYIDAGQLAGAEVVLDGRTVAQADSEPGFYVGPTILDHVNPEMSVYTDEIFGPVLCIVRVEDLDQGLQVINANPYGNGAAIFTTSGGIARDFASRVEVGMVGINVPIPVPMSYYSFGGWKQSLFGDSRAHGLEGVRFFTRSKVVTSRWPKGQPRGVQLSFPVSS